MIPANITASMTHWLIPSSCSTAQRECFLLGIAAITTELLNLFTVLIRKSLRGGKLEEDFFETEYENLLIYESYAEGWMSRLEDRMKYLVLSKTTFYSAKICNFLLIHSFIIWLKTQKWVNMTDCHCIIAPNSQETK